MAVIKTIHVFLAAVFYSVVLLFVGHSFGVRSVLDRDRRRCVCASGYGIYCSRCGHYSHQCPREAWRYDVLSVRSSRLPWASLLKDCPCKTNRNVKASADVKPAESPALN